MSEHITF
jgi:hypothetical protein